MWCLAAASKLRHYCLMSFAVIFYFVHFEIPHLGERAMLSDWRFAGVLLYGRNQLLNFFGMSSVCIDI